MQNCTGAVSLSGSDRSIIFTFSQKHWGVALPQWLFHLTHTYWRYIHDCWAESVFLKAMREMFGQLRHECYSQEYFYIVAVNEQHNHFCLTFFFILVNSVLSWTTNSQMILKINELAITLCFSDTYTLVLLCPMFCCVSLFYKF